MKEKKFVSDIPQLIKEWHPTKNGELLPDNVTMGSIKEIWWMCEHGHEWQATPNNRSRGSGCPYCAGKLPIVGETDLATVNPELAAEWHPTKNGDLLPSHVTCNSGKKVWWQCKKGHEYQARITDRNKGKMCPHCSNESKTSFPEQAIFYYFNKLTTTESRYKLNGKTEIDVYLPEYQIGIEYDGLFFHKGEKSIKREERKNITLHNAGVSLIRVKESKEPEKQKKLDNVVYCKPSPNQYFLNEVIGILINRVNNIASQKFKVDVDIERDRSEIYVQYIENEKKNSVLNLNPDIAVQWHPTKNGTLKPDMIMANSTKKVWWMCEKGHEWQATPNHRSHGYGCPYCSGRLPIVGETDLATVNPELAAEWHPSKNGDITPNKMMAGSTKKVWWLGKCGHEWQDTPNHRSQGRGCPVCAGKRIIVGINDLATVNPKLAAQWHPTRNGNLKPTDVTSGSNKEIWWICEHGHEWQASISNRNTNGRGCPYCAGRLPIVGETDLATVNPELAKQWHPSKNGDLTPSDILPSSGKKVWWMCEHGHEWQTAVANRSAGNGCPHCSGRKPILRKNDLLTTNLKLAKEWHPTKNGDLLPSHVSIGSGQKVWWICEHGHEWQATVTSRNKGSGCPYCAGKKVIIGINDLATVNPELAKEWHPTKNGDLLPSHVSIGSGQKVWWRCEHGHEWQASISNRNTNGRGCPYCAGRLPIIGETDLATVNPKLAAQWHPTKNGDLKPTDVTSGSSKTVWWRCEHGHEWEASIYSRSVNKNDCPYCSGVKVLSGFNDLATVNPELAKQWHPTKNGDLLPSHVLPGSDKKVWWQCEKGHEYQAYIYHRNRGSGCPFCAGKKVLRGFNDFATLHPELLVYWDYEKNNIKPWEVTSGSSKDNIWWKCKSGHSFQMDVKRMVRGYRCPYCSGRKDYK